MIAVGYIGLKIKYITKLISSVTFYFFKDYLFIYREWGKETETEGEKN